MARTKSSAIRRQPSELHMQSNGVVHRDGFSSQSVPAMLDEKLIVDDSSIRPIASSAKTKGQDGGFFLLLFCIAGIYTTFLRWSFLQERLTTTNYGSSSSPKKFTYSILLNTVQSFFATIVGLIYLYCTTTHPHKAGRPAPIFPSLRILGPLLLVSITASLASPFGYASLRHVDYVTFTLAKSCKLLPVMFLHFTLFRTRYPLHKYLVVGVITLGVSVFTLYGSSSKAGKHNSKRSGDAAKYWGLFLLFVNLLFDGFTNSMQDNIKATFRPYGGQQMMCAMNTLSTLLTSTYLLLAPYIGPTILGQYVGMGNGSELSDALSFIKAHPSVGWDVLQFALCGAFGQIFIYLTLSNFGSLTLTTLTVTRKMWSMLLSIFMYGHRLSSGQWTGVGLVFFGVGVEALMKTLEDKEKAKKAKARVLSGAGQDRARQEREEKLSGGERKNRAKRE